MFVYPGSMLDRRLDRMQINYRDSHNAFSEFISVNDAEVHNFASLIKMQNIESLFFKDSEKMSLDTVQSVHTS